MSHWVLLFIVMALLMGGCASQYGTSYNDLPYGPYDEYYEYREANAP